MAKKFEHTTAEPGELLLDIENPRFGLGSAVSQDEAIEMLVRDAKVKELWDSINSQGWIDFEPLVALAAKQDGKWIIIEGNRRVAAIQTLLEPDRLPPALAKRVPPMSSLARDTIKDLAILVVENRHDADAFIGFKHVNGPASWGSLAKAKFALAMFERAIASGKDPEAALVEVQEALGDTNSTSIVRMLMAYKVFEQAVENDFISSEKIEAGVTGFSHLYTMMPNPASRAFIGLGEKSITASSIVDNPVPTSHLDQLNYFIGWLFGNDRAEKVISSQGTDRPSLQKVLAQLSARETLIATGDLAKAVSEIGLDVGDWRNRLIKLEKQAKELSTDLFDLQENLSLEIATDARKRAQAAGRACNSIVASLAPKSQPDFFE